MILIFSLSYRIHQTVHGRDYHEREMNESKTFLVSVIGKTIDKFSMENDGTVVANYEKMNYINTYKFKSVLREIDIRGG